MDEVQENSIEQVVPVETEIQESVEQPPVETANDRNWKELNRVKKELERKAKLQEEMIERLMKHQPQQAPLAPVIDEIETISEDDFLNKGKSKRLVKKEVEPLQKRIEELESRLQQQSTQAMFNSLKTKYTDFDDVVNAETIAILEEKEPELAQTIIDLKDPYKIGVQTYKYIKALNISEDVPNARRSKEVDKKIEQNKKTVQSPQAFDKRPMAQAFKLTESEKTKLYEEMTGCASRESFVPYIS